MDAMNMLEALQQAMQHGQQQAGLNSGQQTPQKLSSCGVYNPEVMAQPNKEHGFWESHAVGKLSGPTAEDILRERLKDANRRYQAAFQENMELRVKIMAMETKPLAMADAAPKDEKLPDWHGPDPSTPSYHHHKRAYDTATDLLNGRITNDGSRRELRKALDAADKQAPKVVPGIGRALKFGPGNHMKIGLVT